jgi:hypothetical protein
MWKWMGTRDDLDDLKKKSIALLGIRTPDFSARSLFTVPAPLASSLYAEDTGFPYTPKRNFQARDAFSRRVSYSGGSRLEPYLLASLIGILYGVFSGLRYKSK